MTQAMDITFWIITIPLFVWSFLNFQAKSTYEGSRDNMVLVWAHIFVGRILGLGILAGSILIAWAIRLR